MRKIIPVFEGIRNMCIFVGNVQEITEVWMFGFDTLFEKKYVSVYIRVPVVEINDVKCITYDDLLGVVENLDISSVIEEELQQATGLGFALRYAVRTQLEHKSNYSGKIREQEVDGFVRKIVDEKIIVGNSNETERNFLYDKQTYQRPTTCLYPIEFKILWDCFERVYFKGNRI